MDRKKIQPKIKGREYIKEKKNKNKRRRERRGVRNQGKRERTTKKSMKR